MHSVSPLGANLAFSSFFAVFWTKARKSIFSRSPENTKLLQQTQFETSTKNRLMATTSLHLWECRDEKCPRKSTKNIYTRECRLSKQAVNAGTDVKSK